MLQPERLIIIPEALAIEIGLHEAIVLLGIERLMQADKTTFGSTSWAYGNTPKLKRTFPYLSEKAIERAINSLIKRNLIVEGSFGSKRNDTTRWLTVNYPECRRLAFYTEEPTQPVTVTNLKKPAPEPEEESRGGYLFDLSVTEEEERTQQVAYDRRCLRACVTAMMQGCNFDSKLLPEADRLNVLNTVKTLDLATRYPQKQTEVYYRMMYGFSVWYRVKLRNDRYAYPNPAAYLKYWGRYEEYCWNELGRQTPTDEMLDSIIPV